jgi:hypothetical protein
VHRKSGKKAVAQFNSVNPSRTIPNILMIVNHDTRSYESDFVEAVIGYVEGLGKTARPLRDDIAEIDAYVWLNAATSEAAHFWQQNLFRDTVIELLQPGSYRAMRLRIVGESPFNM